MLFFNVIETEKDKEEYLILYEKYQKFVYYIARQHLNDHNLAEDCQQEVFLYIAKNFQYIRNKSTEESIKGLIFTITKSIAIDMYRKNIKNNAIINADISDLGYIKDVDFDMCDEIALNCAIDKLPEEYKNVIYLKYFYDFSSSEISKLCGISPSLVRKRIMIAKKMMKKYLK